MDQTETLTVVEAKNYSTKADGTPLVGQWGPYFRSVIKVNEYTEPLSGFPKHEIRAGQVLEAVVTKETYNGREQLKFKVTKSSGGNAHAAPAKAVQAPATDLVRAIDTQTSLLRDILNRMEAMYLTFSTVQTLAPKKKKAVAPIEEPDPDEIRLMDADTDDEDEGDTDGFGPY